MNESDWEQSFMKNKKLFSNFGRNGQTISRILDSNLPKSNPNNLYFYDGVHTVRNIQTKDEKLQRDLNSKVFEHITDEKIVKGFVDAENINALYFLNNNKKLVKTMTASYYHSVADDLAEILFALETYPDAELILDVSNVSDFLNNPTFNFVKFFLDKIAEKFGTKYHLADISKYDILYIDNFALLAFPFHSGARLDILSDFMFQFSTNKNVKSTRKIFVSRKLNGRVEPNPNAINFSYTDDNRIDDHNKLEAIFADLGFEIIDPESFKSFQDQIDLFYSAKTIVSLTSSGLTNGIFMQPGGTIVEIVTPLITKSPLIHSDYFAENNLDPMASELDLHMVQEIHMFYHNLAFFKNHTYVGIPNFERSHKKVNDFINNNEKLKRYLSE